MSLALNDALLDAGEPLQPMWSPGIAYLGQVDSSDSAIAVAEDLQLDLILHFDISLKQIREGLVQNVSRCRLLQVAPPTDSQGRKRHLLITSKGMDNLESQQMAAADRMSEREYINDQLNSLWNLIDRDIKVIDLPKLSSEVANRRISNLLASPKRSMRTLAEVRYYQAMDLINASDVEQVFHIAGGEDGLILLYGPARSKNRTQSKMGSGVGPTNRVVDGYSTCSAPRVVHLLRLQSRGTSILASTARNSSSIDLPSISDSAVN